jgi:hypothetical protein
MVEHAIRTCISRTLATKGCHPSARFRAESPRQMTEQVHDSMSGVGSASEAACGSEVAGYGPSQSRAPGPWRRTVVHALCATLPASEKVPGVDPKRCAEFLRRFSREAPRLPRLALHVAVLVFQGSPPLTGAGWRPALWLTPEALARHSEKLASHPLYHLRQVSLMLKTMAGLVWGADPAVRAALFMEPYADDPSHWRER